ncbi:hypothetical protein DERP_003033 [Dermatophagoides pteronyssinus]|uniref:Uncharacterized protein n=1 Tax=Dermatophagoides pteronyssinus TaxID=6956 RepID=A0ABQ8JIU2_DERPT|nr:hypothetical protein DERP_003033 [Dermatophagoides pteronyssinus]
MIVDAKHIFVIDDGCRNVETDDDDCELRFVVLVKIVDGVLVEIVLVVNKYGSFNSKGNGCCLSDFMAHISTIPTQIIYLPENGYHFAPLVVPFGNDSLEPSGHGFP